MRKTEQHYTQDLIDARTERGIQTFMLPADHVMAKRYVALLQKHYPGWSWCVEVPPGQGVVIIRNFDIEDCRRMYGCVLHARVCDDRMVRNAGGEILERYRRSRAPNAVRATRDQIIIRAE